MENQVTSIEQSKRLIDLGVPAEKASMIYQSHFTQGVPKLYAQPYQRNGYPPKEKIREDVVPAFTVADLLGMIPAEITYGRLYVSHPKIPSVKNDFNVFYKRVGREKGAIKSFRHPNLTCACVMMVEWLLSNGYELNL